MFANDVGFSSIRGFTEDRRRWRVLVQTWPDDQGYRGRFVFLTDQPHRVHDQRTGPDALRANSREELIADAYLLPEQRLRQVFRSLV
jgi:hypothetical protein